MQAVSFPAVRSKAPLTTRSPHLGQLSRRAARHLPLGAGTGGRVETAQARQHHPGRHQAVCQRLTSQRTGRAPTRQSVPTTSMFSTRARVGKIDSSSVGVSVSRSRRHSMLKPPQIPSSSGVWRKMPEAAPDGERTWTSVFSDMTSTAVVTDRYFVCFSVVLIDQWSGL